MIVYLVADHGGCQWLVVGIFSSEEKAEDVMEELMEPYTFDASNYYSIHEIEMDKKIEDMIGFIE